MPNKKYTPVKQKTKTRRRVSGVSPMLHSNKNSGKLRQMPVKNAQRMNRSIVAEGYTYWVASDPTYYDNKEVGEQCWHLTPCQDRSYECVIGRGTGFADVNGLTYPRGWCIKTGDINLGPSPQ